MSKSIGKLLEWSATVPSELHIMLLAVNVMSVVFLSHVNCTFVKFVSMFGSC